MNIVRGVRPEGHFTVVRNDVLRDPQISYRSLGLLVHILSHSDNWRTTSATLAERDKEGVQAIRTAMRELTQAGYIEYRRAQDPETGRWTTETVVFDTPTHLRNPAPAKKRDEFSAEASRIVRDYWEPAAKGVVNQPAVAVVMMIAEALRNGIDAKRLATAVAKVAKSRQTLTKVRLDEALNGPRPRKQLAADRKTDWQALKQNAGVIDGDELPF